MSPAPDAAAPPDVPAGADAHPPPTRGRAGVGRPRRIWYRWCSAGAPAEREALRWWLVTRLAIWWTAAHAAWLFGSGATVPSYLDRWYTWDTQLYVKIARYGYSGPPGNDTPLEAFFPGLPLTLRAVHLVVADWRLAGLVVSLPAGVVAVTSLVRLTGLDHGPRAAAKAGLLFAVSPFTVFLTAGYSEALFLAFAVPAWLHARRNRWSTACLLAAGASAVRVNGLFLAAALVVEFVAGHLPPRLRPDRVGAAPPRLRAAPWLVVPLLPLLAYSAYLRLRTGDWLYWLVAESRGWHRHYSGFVGAFRTTWNAAFGTAYSPDWQWAFRTEIVAVAIGVLLVAALCVRLRWGEATYVALSLFALATSTWYFSVARTALLWWPLWGGLGAVAAHPRLGRWFTGIFLAVSTPLAVLLTAAFTTWRWAG